MAEAIPVLLYHSVRERPLRGFGRWTVTPTVFAAHVDAVVASGRTPLTITRLARMLRGSGELPRRAVAITFDDGFDDTVDAVRHLLERRIPSTVYVTLGHIRAEAMMSQRALAELTRLAPQVEIGAHGIRHLRLDELDPGAVAREVGQSRAWLEQLTQRRVSSFAYPHGAHDAGVRAAVVEAGYESAAAVKNAFSHPRDDAFAIARWTVTRTATPATIERLLAGEGAVLAAGRERLRTSAWRTVRRARRRGARRAR